MVASNGRSQPFFFHVGGSGLVIESLFNEIDASIERVRSSCETEESRSVLYLLLASASMSASRSVVSVMLITMTFWFIKSDFVNFTKKFFCCFCSLGLRKEISALTNASEDVLSKR